MATFEEQYGEMIGEIITNGISNKSLDVRTYWKDGEPAYTNALWGRMFRIKPEDGFPILTKKWVNPKSFTSEILWIMQHASNVVQDARDLGTGVWDEWEQEDGTIGTAYGYQIRNNYYQVGVNDISDKALRAIGKNILDVDEGKDNYAVEIVDGEEVVKLTQIDYVIYQLIDNPYSRQTITTLMNPKEHHKMALPPCVWSSHWEIMADGRLYLSVKARSTDTFLGLPYNISQYALLHRLIAHVTGRELGDFIFVMDDVHLYDRHIDKAIEYLQNESKEVPTLWIDETVTGFKDFVYEENFGFNGYEKEDFSVIKAPIAVGFHELDKEVQEKLQK